MGRQARRSIGVENTNFHVLFEVLIPFLIYLVADVCPCVRRHRRGGGRAHQRHVPQGGHRPFGLAHEHRLGQRVARAHLCPERHRVRASGNPASLGHAGYVGERAHHELHAHPARLRAHLRASGHAISVGACHGSLPCAPRREAPLRESDLRSALHHDVLRSQGHHHALHHVLHSHLCCLRGRPTCPFPSASC